MFPPEVADSGPCECHPGGLAVQILVNLWIPRRDRAAMEASMFLSDPLALS